LTFFGIKEAISGTRIARATELGIMKVDFLGKGITTNTTHLAKWFTTKGETVIIKLKNAGATNEMLETALKKGAKLDSTHFVTKGATQTLWLEESTVIDLSEGGWKHIVAGKHPADFKKYFNLANEDQAVKDFIKNVAKTASKDPTDPYRLVKKVYSPSLKKEIDVRIITFDTTDSAIKTAYPRIN